jgi:hypothetical protein
LVALQDIHTAIAAREMAGALIADELESGKFFISKLTEQDAFEAIKMGHFHYYGWGANA